MSIKKLCVNNFSISALPPGNMLLMCVIRTAVILTLRYYKVLPFYAMAKKCSKIQYLEGNESNSRARRQCECEVNGSRVNQSGL